MCTCISNLKACKTSKIKEKVKNELSGRLSWSRLLPDWHLSSGACISSAKTSNIQCKNFLEFRRLQFCDSRFSHLEASKVGQRYENFPFAEYYLCMVSGYKNYPSSLILSYKQFLGLGIFPLPIEIKMIAILKKSSLFSIINNFILS